MISLRLVAVFLLAYSLPALAAIQQSQSIVAGGAPYRLAVDPVTSRVFATNAGTSMSGAGYGLGVIDPDGHVTSIHLSSMPDDVAISPLFRTAVVPINNCTCTALVNVDTLAVTMTGGGKNSRGIVLIEATGHAYVLSAGLNTRVDGSIIDIDLRTGTSTTYPVPQFGVVHMAASVDAMKLYVTGTDSGGVGQWPVGYMQAFDLSTKSMVGSRVAVGRQALQVVVPAGGSQVYLLGHSDYVDTAFPVGSTNRNSMQPTLFVLDAATLATQKSILLPFTTNSQIFGPLLAGTASLDPTTGIVYVADAVNKRFMIVDPAAGSMKEIDVESNVNTVNANPAAGNVIVGLNALGLAAIYSPSGERLDTVPAGTPIVPDSHDPNGISILFGAASSELGTSFVDSAGNAYLTSSHDKTVTVLKRSDSSASVVNLTDVWSDPADPGWGVFVQQQGSIAFAALFIHDASGAPRWVVMTQGIRQGDGSFSGGLYRTTGPASATGAATTSLVGSMSFAPQTLQSATLSYTLDGMAVTRTVSRLPIAAVPRTCAWSVTNSLKSAPSASNNFTSLWWNPAQSGWGLALSHQGETAFAVVFGYDASNQASWSVMSNGPEAASGTFAGTLYRAKSSGMQDAGNLSLSFTGSDAGTLSYSLDGVQVTSPIIREEFATPASRCSS